MAKPKSEPNMIAQLKSKSTSPLRAGGFTWKDDVAAPPKSPKSTQGSLDKGSAGAPPTNLQGELPRTAGGNLDIGEIRSTFADQMNKARKSRSKGA